MKTKIVAISLSLLNVITAFAQVSDDIIGNWHTENNNAKVKIVKVGTKYYGNIIWLKEPNRADGTVKLDEKNPDAAKRTNKILGSTILKEFTFDSDDKNWTNGKIYDPKNGKTYSCIITLKDGKLDVRGYVLGMKWIGRTQTWTKSE